MGLYRFVGKNYPKVGTKNNPTTVRDWEKSHHYWWYECLRRNEHYLKVCEMEGKAPPKGEYKGMRKLYEDFGDVRVGFRSWWSFRAEKGGDNRGAILFGEPASSLGVRVVTKEEVNDEEGYLFVRIPLRITKKQVKKDIDEILSGLHQEAIGKDRKAKETYQYRNGERRRKVVVKRYFKESKAKYKFSGPVNILAIKKALAVWDFRQANPDVKLWQIQIKRNAAEDSYECYVDDRQSSKFKDEDNLNRQSQAAAISRYERKAREMIFNAGQGSFPQERELP